MYCIGILIEELRMKNIIADLPKGPLDPYRKCATFDWKLLKLNLEGEEFVKFQVFGKRFYTSNIFNTVSYLKFLCHSRILYGIL